MLDKWGNEMNAVKKVKLMGILNVTPDSFSDGGVFFEVEKAIARGIQMAKDGADIIDIGGESTRPGSLPVSEEEEFLRVIPVIKELINRVSIPISIDTCKPKIAAAAVEAGASYINDVTGFRHEEMINVAAATGVPVFCMHMLGIPKEMQQNPHYDGGVIDCLLRWGEACIKKMTDGGIKEEQIILDPGIGFGKTVAHNLEILHNLPRLRELGRPLLIGASRKSFMTRILGKSPGELEAATLAVHTVAMMGNVDFIRAHDVVPHVDAINMVHAIRNLVF